MTATLDTIKTTKTTPRPVRGERYFSIALWSAEEDAPKVGGYAVTWGSRYGVAVDRSDTEWGQVFTTRAALEEHSWLLRRFREGVHRRARARIVLVEWAGQYTTIVELGEEITR